MKRPSVQQTIHTALITAFTIAAALFWKDFIGIVAETYLPQEGTLFAELLIALFATFIVIVAINLLYKAEDEVVEVVDEVSHLRQRFISPHTIQQERTIEVRSAQKPLKRSGKKVQKRAS